MQTSTPNPKNTSPTLPPSHPAFIPILAEVNRRCVHEGCQSAAGFCRDVVAMADDWLANPTSEVVDRLSRKQVSALDLAELSAYLLDRANALDISRLVA